MMYIVPFITLSLVAQSSCLAYTKPEPYPVKLEFKIVESLEAKRTLTDHRNQLKKRDAFSAALSKFDEGDVRESFYVTDLYLGTRNEKCTVVIDTGSSDLWVKRDSYDPSRSITSKPLGEIFLAIYPDSSYAIGEYYTDSVGFNSTSPLLSKTQFAAANSSTMGIFGIGKMKSEFAPHKYANFPLALQNSGVTSTASYSLYLDPDGQTGSVIFGGIDTKKFTGDLTEYPMVDSSIGSAINLESITLNGIDLELNKPFILNSGALLGTLPRNIMEKFDRFFHLTVKTINKIDFREVKCDLPSNQYIHFNFGKNSIHIPHRGLVMKQKDGTCLFGFGYFNDMTILGEPFFRSAYVHFDLTAETISLAQVNQTEESSMVMR